MITQDLTERNIGKIRLTLVARQIYEDYVIDLDKMGLSLLYRQSQSVSPTKFDCHAIGQSLIGGTTKNYVMTKYRRQITMQMQNKIFSIKLRTSDWLFPHDVYQMGFESFSWKD